MSTANTFHLSVASVGETHFDGRVVSVTLPGESGVFTVLSRHEPLVATLKAGTITIRLSAMPAHAGQAGDGVEKSKTLLIENGVLEVSGNRAVVLL